MSLVDHARYELSLLNNDAEFNDCIIKAVEAFAAYGHSGGSAPVGIAILNDLLQFKNLSPLTSDPREWMEVIDGTWQSRRRSDAFSHDGGKNYYLLSQGASETNPFPLYPSRIMEVPNG